MSKEAILQEYVEACESAGIDPHPNFMAYLQETMDDEESIDLVVHGNQKENFNNRIEDKDLIVISDVLEPYAIYVEDIDLRYNHISDAGAEALSRLVMRASRLLGLNL